MYVCMHVCMYVCIITIIVAIDIVILHLSSSQVSTYVLTIYAMTTTTLFI